MRSTKAEKSDIKVFFSYFKPHKKLFILDMLCAAAASAIDLVFPFVTRVSMTRLLPDRLYTAFFAVMAAIVAAYMLKAGCYYFITVYGHRMGVAIEADMRHDVFNHIQSLSFSFFDKNRTGALMSRITSDLFEITELAHHGPEDVLISALTIIGSLVIMFGIEWRLALVLAVCLPPLILFTLSKRKRFMQANIEVKTKTGEINAAVESGISGIRTAKAFANESEEDEKFVFVNEKYKTAKNKYYNAMGGFMSGMEFSTSIMQVIVITAGGFFIMRGNMDYIDLVTFSLYVSAFVAPVRRLSSFFETFMQGAAGFSRFLTLMRTQPDVVDIPDAEELPRVRGEVEYRDVSFGYGEGMPSILSHVDLKIAPGECLAVVGPSGGGKTTLCQLLPRFYDVTGGSITIDGHDVRRVTQKSLHRNIGVIQQDVFMFAGTIRDNIRYGRPDATDLEVAVAARRAQIHEEIMQMPSNYDAYIGERGVMLSGGQKQRLAIARVFLKDPPLLILDEATSALDTVTEQHIQASLDELSRGRTCIIIAHRLSTVNGADKIAVIDDQSIVEYGTHAQLMADNGVYAQLYNAQTLQGAE